MSATITMGREGTQNHSGEPGEVVSLHPEMDQTDMTSVVGMVVFLGSWAMMFLALFFSYLLIRLNSASWPPVGYEELPVLLPALNTLLMVGSSMVYHQAWLKLRQGNADAFFKGLLITLVMGIAFMLLQGRLWISQWTGGLELTSNLYGGFLYLLTVFHALHVVVGIGLLLWLVPQVRRASAVASRGVRARVVGMFWHFVDVAWVATFFLVFVL